MRDLIFKSIRAHADGANWVRVPAHLRQGPLPDTWPASWRYATQQDAIWGRG
jgi:hypothetical protein